MESVTSDLARDRPDAYLARDRRRALHAGRSLPDRVAGAALFADISGFTPLTEALANELGSQRGAEELVANIGRVFHAVIEALDAFDGNVISFAGDAITCWLDGDDGSRACAAAIGMQEAIARTGTITTPGGATVQLAMKVAIAVGSARRFVVGDPDIQLIDVLAGRLLDLLAAAEHHAEKGEIVLDQSAVAALGGRVALGASREDPDTERTLRVLDALLVDIPPEPGDEPPPLPEETVRPWLLPAVYERLRTGRGEFLAELRPAIPVFLHFSGIDYDRADDAIDKLDTFVRAAEGVMHRYGGNILQLTLGDKGAYLYGVFGSPLAHEDDAARAAAAALELLDLEQSTEARAISIGLTHGRLRSGTYGHSMRRTFVCMGDAVNLAARLMSKAPAGSVYVTDVVREAAGESFIWQRLEPMRVKGKTEVIHAWSLTGSLERASRRRTRFELDLIGREAELGLLMGRHAESLQGRGRTVGIAAEAGMGKSRLVAEFVREARRAGHTVAFGECQAYGTRTPYFVWREIWRVLLGLDDEASPAEQITHLEARLGDIDPGLVARTALLADVVGLPIPDSDLTRGFDAKLRKASLEDLLADVLRARARDAPFVAVLEDCHWIDELSRDLLRVLVRAASALPVLFVLAYRPSTEPGGALGVNEERGFGELVLAELDEGSIAVLARAKAVQLSGGAGLVSDDLVALVAERAEGNPFYAEELLSYLVTHGVDLADPAAAATVQLPDSLHSLVLSRIDAAAEGPRRTMKVASVVGRVFEAPTLTGAYEELGALATVLDDLDALQALDLVSLDRAADMAWMFKHMVTQEVAYESLPFALRADLHGRVGRYLERRGMQDLERWVPILEHHFWRSDDAPRKLEYLRRAASQAQAAYANSAAIAYYERLLTLVDGADRVATLLALGKVLDLIGEWDRATEVGEAALEKADALADADSAAWARTALADIARKRGRFDEANTLLEAAADGFRAAGDDAGVGQVLHLSGTVSAMRGDLEGARARYLESLAIRERLGDQAKVGALYSNLAIVAEYEGDLEEADRLSRLAYTIRVAAGDRWGIGVSLHNLGVYAVRLGRPAEAREHVEQAIRIMTEVGDRGFAASERMLMASLDRDEGRLASARAQYLEVFPVYLEMDDPIAQAELLEDVALLAAACGEHERTFELVGAGAALRESIGNEESGASVEQYAARLVSSIEAIGQDRADGAQARGRQLTVAEAFAVAMRLCGAEDLA